MNPDRDRQDRTRWPFPGDTPLQRARRVAIAYRQHLRTANPTVCDALDDAARGFGETWVCGDVVTTPADALLTTAEAAELAGVDLETVRQWRKRGYVSRTGERRFLQSTGTNAQGWPLFLAEHILEVAATTRQTRLRRR